MARRRKEPLVLVFVPALAALLARAEEVNGRVLTAAQIRRIRDGAEVIAVPRAAARALAESRGYDDLDPEDCVAGWRALRKVLRRPR